MHNIRKSVILTELKTAKDIITYWEERLNEGIPFVDFVAPQEELELFTTMFVGELRTLAGKMDNLADIISNVR